MHRIAGVVYDRAFGQRPMVESGSFSFQFWRGNHAK
jgi:hypothetical protein